MFLDQSTSESDILSNSSSGGFSKYAIGVLVTVVCFFVGFGAWGYSWSQKYTDRVAPNVSIGSMDVSGKSLNEVRILLQKKADDLLTQGVDVQLNGETKTLPLATLIGSDLVDDLQIDIDQTAQSALTVHHHTNILLNETTLLASLFKQTTLPVVFTIQDNDVIKSIHSLFSSIEKPASDTSFIFSQSTAGWTIQTKEGIEGTEIEENSFLITLRDQLQWLKSDPIEVTLVAKAPSVSASEAELLVPELQKILQAAPYSFTYTEDDGTVSDWSLTTKILTKLLVPLPNKSIGLDKEMFDAFTKPITTFINHPAKNARFQITGNRATEFAQNEDGRSVDESRLYLDTLKAIQTQSTSPIPVVTQIEKSAVTTATVNDLGITDKLGTGFSSYKGSPKNRKINIQNGVNLLNGLLIAPGEIFSAIQVLKPFTTENGYLPELVIKGDKIQPELGGGLCQIGTTIFRATMNSGFPVTERSNHSLAVSYYNDPSNHNPGTDATIYEPAPDFKFTNDTGHYVLLQAENLKDKQQLQFTFWGTSDGRKGSYSPPVVLRRLPVGEQVTTETPDLKPGEEKCQEAHPGADATFTYSVKHADGTISEKVFNSHYRPLPKMCLVGVDPTKIKEVDPQDPAPVTPTNPI